MATLRQQVLRRKNVMAMAAETGADTGGSELAMPRRKLPVALVPSLVLPPSQTTTLSNLTLLIACAAVFESASMCSSIIIWKAGCAPPQASMMRFRPSPFLARISNWPRASASSRA